jgi:hypothetical protein
LPVTHAWCDVFLSLWSCLYACQLCAGADEAQRKRWRIKGPESYSYINQSGCMTLTEVKDEDEWAATKAAMNTMGFRESDKDAIFTALAGLLHLGTRSTMVFAAAVPLTSECLLWAG